MREFATRTVVFLAFLVLAAGSAGVPEAFCGQGVQAAGKAAPGQEDVSGGQREILARLPNGLLVYIIKDSRFPLVCSRLYVRAGSANEEPDKAGISHLLEHMVFKGTAHRPKGEVARQVEALGGYLNAATSFDKTWYITDMPAEHWRLGMDVVKDMAFQATLDPQELESEKEVVISELQRGEDAPMRKLYENLQVAALKNTPYGRPIIGYEDTIRAITAQDLRAYVEKWYQPQNMMLLVAGDIRPGEVLGHARKLFGNLANSSDLNVPEPLDLAEAARGSAQVEVSRGPWNKVYLGLALPVPGIRDLRSIDLDVLSYLLGGDGTSAFYKKYKYESRLVDSISVGNMSLARAGLLSVTARLDPEKVEQFWRELTRDLAGLSAGAFDGEAIARAKFNLEDSMDRAAETLSGLAAWKGVIQFELGGGQAEKNVRFAQANVDKPQLQRAIAQWLDSGRARVRVMAPENASLPDLAAIMRENWPQAAKDGESGPGRDAGHAREDIELGNGCRLILLPDESAPYMSFELLMPGGNAMLAPGEQGLAELTARLLTDGCGDLDHAAMERWLAERAASVSVRSGLQTFGISMSGPSRFSGEYFSMLSAMLRMPRFEGQELLRELENMKAAIRQRDDQPLSFMFSRLNPFLFPGGQPYGYDNLGDIKTLGEFNVARVRDFWARQGRQPWILAIAGSFEREAAVAFARSLARPAADAFAAGAPEWNEKARELNLALPGRNQAHLLRIFKTVPPTHPDAPALMLLQSAISGQSGILFSKLRDEQGLGYTVSCFNRSMPRAGFMAFYIGTTSEKLEQAREGFARIIERLKTEPLPEEVIKAGANRLWGDYMRERQSLASRAGEAATDAVLNYPAEFQKQLLDKARSLTARDVQAIAAKYLVDAYEVVLRP